MFTRKLIAVAAVAMSCSAHAAIRFESRNNAGGVIALTDTRVSGCPSDAFAAIAQGSDGSSLFGCWSFVPPNLVDVTWQDGQIRIYNVEDFTAVGK